MKKVHSKAAASPRRWWRWPVAVASAAGLALGAPLVVAQEAPGGSQPQQQQPWQQPGPGGAERGMPGMGAGAAEACPEGNVSVAELLVAAADPSVLEDKQVELKQVEVVHKLGDKALLVKPVGQILEDLGGEPTAGQGAWETQGQDRQQQGGQALDQALERDQAQPRSGQEQAREGQQTQPDGEEALLLVTLEQLEGQQAQQGDTPQRQQAQQPASQAQGSSSQGEALRAADVQVGQILVIEGTIKDIEDGGLPDFSSDELGEVERSTLEEHNILVEASSLHRDTSSTSALR